MKDSDKKKRVKGRFDFLIKRGEMSGEKWNVRCSDVDYLVEVRYGDMEGRGEVLVNGWVIDRWGPSIFALPKQRTFELGDNKAVLKRKGIIWHLELYVEGAEVTRL